FVGFQLDLSDDRLRRFAWAFMLSGWIPALWGLRQHFVGLTTAEQLYARHIGTFWAGTEIRAFSTFQAPWGLAAYSGGVALVAFSLFLGARGLTRKLVAIIGCVLASSALVFTHVRGCLLGYAAGMLFLV